jgi:hypothetical protein
VEEKSDINGFRRPLAASYTRLSVRLRRVLHASYIRLTRALVESKSSPNKSHTTKLKFTGTIIHGHKHKTQRSQVEEFFNENNT